MKSKITTLILSLITSISLAQITFVKEVSYEDDYNFPLSTGTIDFNTKNLIENSEYIIKQIKESNKYDLLDYNFNLYKSMTLDTTNNVLEGKVYFEGVYFTNHLINTDDKIEVIYSPIVVDMEGKALPLKTIIADENNNIIQTLDNEVLGYPAFYTIKGKTFLLTRTSLQHRNGSLKIYEVAGNLPCIQCNSKASNTNTTKSPAPNYAFKIFPNPTDGQLNIESDLDELNMQIKIYSTSGQLLQTNPFFYGTNSVNVSSLASGTYVINIVSDKGFLHTEKFVKR